MDNTVIIILGIILLVLIILNHITIITTTTSEANCSQTAFGCCPDGVNSKVNFYGTNCPGYRPGPGYYPTPNIPPPPGPGPLPPKPVGGCAGTRYGCCPNNQTPKINPQGSNCVLN
jgi:hypothetical protein